MLKKETRNYIFLKISEICGDYQAVCPCPGKLSWLPVVGILGKKSTVSHSMPHYSTCLFTMTQGEPTFLEWETASWQSNWPSVTEMSCLHPGRDSSLLAKRKLLLLFLFSTLRNELYQVRISVPSSCLTVMGESPRLAVLETSPPSPATPQLLISLNGTFREHWLFSSFANGYGKNQLPFMEFYENQYETWDRSWSYRWFELWYCN